MEKYYSVTLRGEQRGKVLVQRQGLYYRFHCRCDLSGDQIYRLMVHCGSRRESIGILIPEEGSFRLDTRKPVKQIGEGDMSFTLALPKETVNGNFTPIRPEEPFAYIARLKQSFLVLQHGQAGIAVEKMQEC